MNNELNDSLEDIFGAPSGDVRVEPIRAPADFKPRDFTETCHKCNGRGQFISWSGRVMGPCFSCKGAGRKTFKKPANERAKVREQVAVRKEARKQADVDAFAAANPQIWAWMNESAPTFSFAASMLEAVSKWGDLTEKQLAACQRCVDSRQKAQEARAERAANAPVVDTTGIDRLKAAFDKAIAFSAAKGLKKSPKITIGCTTISPAKATSANPGALYVKDGSQYLGKIVNGKFFGSRECSTEREGEILKFVADPKAAAEVYGQETGTCCICNATLTSEWKFRGIGPICAEKFGW